MAYIHMYMELHTQNHDVIKKTTVRTCKTPTSKTRPSSGDLVRPKNVGVSVRQSAQALNEMYRVAHEMFQYFI
jgi:hypothetical protein